MKPRVDTLAASGVFLVSAAEFLDTGTAAGRLMSNIMTAVSQWEREPKYRDPKTGRNLKATIWCGDFLIAGRRVKESAKTSRMIIAVEPEKKQSPQWPVRPSRCGAAQRSQADNQTLF